MNVYLLLLANDDKATIDDIDIAVFTTRDAAKAAQAIIQEAHPKAVVALITRTSDPPDASLIF